ncbi:corticotropin-releasing factor receptor 1 [Anoplopoma fimbria]|uniref:corticotropin-releasing factor receptor 1 n=1 Tax=Anoplopoma fimbria TaxID=229290 RepID=UPI0023EB736D|nr:corticotropin-releasing factor receptor 1 [Anoplopoma fimbria]
MSLTLILNDPFDFDCGVTCILLNKDSYMSLAHIPPLTQGLKVALLFSPDPPECLKLLTEITVLKHLNVEVPDLEHPHLDFISEPVELHMNPQNQSLFVSLSYDSPPLSWLAVWNLLKQERRQQGASLHWLLQAAGVSTLGQVVELAGPQLKDPTGLPAHPVSLEGASGKTFYKLMWKDEEDILLSLETPQLGAFEPLVNEATYPVSVKVSNHNNLVFQVMLTCVLLSGRVSPAELTCEALILLSTNLSARTLALLNQTFTISNTSGLYCDLSVDGIGTCWPRSAAGQLISRACPEKFNGIHYNTTNRVYRECQSNGSWAPRGNYSQCTEIIILRKSKVHYQVAVIINYLGHCISLGALLLAFTLFMRLRSIRCLRNIIHWNLISAFILRNATWFIVQLTMNPAVTESNQVWCRLVTAGYNYFHVTNFFWMFGEGCYLHTAVVLTYSTDRLRKWMFICIGWGIPFPIIVAWAFGKLYYDNEKCWFGKKAGVYTDYIYQGPMILVLLINFVFLFNIVRILMTKLRASTTSETIQYRKAVKATLVLLPLLGITYMLFFVNPGGEDEVAQIVFIYFNSILESFQGFFVSVFYCFLNSEVRSAVRKRWIRWQDRHSFRSRAVRATSLPTSPSRVSFHSINQSSNL